MGNQLRRCETDRVLAGVAGGLAQRFGISSTLVRLAWVLSVFFGGLGILLYVILWNSPAQGHVVHARDPLRRGALRAR